MYQLICPSLPLLHQQQAPQSHTLQQWVSAALTLNFYQPQSWIKQSPPPATLSYEIKDLNTEDRTQHLALLSVPSFMHAPEQYLLNTLTKVIQSGLTTTTSNTIEARLSFQILRLETILTKDEAWQHLPRLLELLVALHCQTHPDTYINALEAPTITLEELLDARNSIPSAQITAADVLKFVFDFSVYCFDLPVTDLLAQTLATVLTEILCFSRAGGKYPTKLPSTSQVGDEHATELPRTSQAGGDHLHVD